MFFTFQILETITASSNTINININNNLSSTNTTMNDNYNDIFGQQEVELVGHSTTHTPIRQQRNRQHTVCFFFPDFHS